MAIHHVNVNQSRPAPLDRADLFAEAHKIRR
jgi:hypothetical protein